MMTIKALYNKFAIRGKTNVFEEYNSNIDYHPLHANPVFITGAGRSGTHFLSTIFSLGKEIKSYHLDSIGNSVGDSFELFSRWHNLKVDRQGFINSRGFLIKKCKQEKLRFLESNPLIAFSFHNLINAFGGKAVIVYRNPQKVIESHFRKGWYEQNVIFDNNIPGFIYDLKKPNHYFSRFTPINSSEESWKTMSRLQKITWMWVETYKRILENSQLVNSENIIWVCLDDFDYQQYLKLSENVGISEIISQEKFKEIVRKKPGKGATQEKVIWTENDLNYFKVKTEEILGKSSPIKLAPQINQ